MKDKIFALIKENKELAYFWGSVAGFVLLFSTLGLFLLFGARSNFVEAEALKNRLTGIRRFQHQHGDIAAYRGELESKYNKLDEQLPQKIDPNTLLLHINTLSVYGKVKIDNLSVLPDVPTKHNTSYKSHRLQIVCTGQCQQLLDFMKTVEQEENLMLFNDVVLEAREQDMVSLSAVIVYYTRQ